MNSKRNTNTLAKEKTAELIISNVLWLNIFRFASYLNGFLVGAWIIRSFGPNDIGMYAYAVAGSEIVASISGLGINLPLLKELKSEAKNNDDLISAASLVYVGGLFKDAGLFL